jgi:hypothetical protein
MQCNNSWQSILELRWMARRIRKNENAAGHLSYCVPMALRRVPSKQKNKFKNDSKYKAHQVYSHLNK